MTSTKPRIAFAGVGWIGRSRLAAAVKHGGGDIVLISDPSDECLGEALKIAPVKSTKTFDSIIEDPEVDAVVIATPSALHMQQAVAAFESNKAVFCQKPLGRNAEEVRNVIEAARKANKLLGADFSYRHTQTFRKIHEVLKSGELGKIFSVDLKFHNAYGPDKPWFFDMNQSGGGCALDLGIHLLDLMLYSLDFPDVRDVHASLYSKGTPVKDNVTVEDFADVKLSLDGEINASLTCSWNLNAGRDAVIEASFYGTGGGVSMKNVNGSFFDFEAYRYWGTKQELLCGPPDDWGGKALISWIEVLNRNSNFNEEAEEFIKSAQVLDRIYGRY